MSFLGGLFTGGNDKLDESINNAGNIMGFGTATGEGDITNASNFYNDLLAGDPEKTAKLLAPEIGEITGQGQQAKNTIAQFGTRSGGNNSRAQTIDDATRAHIDDMIAHLTGAAAGGDASLGTSALGLGLSANEAQANEAQRRLQDEQNSIFGGLLTRSVNDVAGAIPGF